MKLLRWIAGTIIALGTVAFAVFNLDPITVTWSPFHAPIALPASVFGLALFTLGFVLGGLAAWVGAGAQRREARANKKRLQALEAALDAANARAAEAPSAPAALPPSLLPKP